jgi:hypothetical protein
VTWGFRFSAPPNLCTNETAPHWVWWMP